MHKLLPHNWIKSVLIVLFLSTPLLAPAQEKATPTQEVLAYLKTLGNGKYLFGQMATWIDPL